MKLVSSTPRKLLPLLAEAIEELQAIKPDLFILAYEDPETGEVISWSDGKQAGNTKASQIGLCEIVKHFILLGE